MKNIRIQYNKQLYSSVIQNLVSVGLWAVLVLLTLLARPSLAQNAPDRMSTNKEDAWMSCTPTANPNPVRGVSHWIRYDLGTSRQLNASTFWNINHPDHIASGIKDFAVDISADGTLWQNVGTYTLAQANASGFYSGTTGPDFNHATGRYLLITALSNYGGPCYGFAELRIEALQALPVEISDIWIDCRGLELGWKTSFEWNSKGFMVQHSADARVWEDLGFVPSVVIGQTSYKFDLPPGLADDTYLRLIQTDNNGKTTVSDIRRLDCNSESGLTIVPNPATDLIRINGLTESEDFQIIDVTGRVVRQALYTPDDGINVSNFVPGLYTIKMGSKESRFVKL